VVIVWKNLLGGAWRLKSNCMKSAIGGREIKCPSSTKRRVGATRLLLPSAVGFGNVVQHWSDSLAHGGYIRRSIWTYLIWLLAHLKMWAASVQLFNLGSITKCLPMQTLQIKLVTWGHKVMTCRTSQLEESEWHWPNDSFCTFQIQQNMKWASYVI
jgi:hypothetical protein